MPRGPNDIMSNPKRMVLSKMGVGDILRSSSSMVFEWCRRKTLAPMHHSRSCQLRLHISGSDIRRCNNCLRVCIESNITKKIWTWCRLGWLHIPISFSQWKLGIRRLRRILGVISMECKDYYFQCQRVAGWLKRSRLRSFLVSNKVDMCMIQETKVGVMKEMVVREIWGKKGYHWVAAPSIGMSGGMLII